MPADIVPLRRKVEDIYAVDSTPGRTSYVKRALDDPYGAGELVVDQV